MDRNQLTGLLLISLMLVAYLYFFGEQSGETTDNEIQQEQIVTESDTVKKTKSILVESNFEDTVSQDIDSVMTSEISELYGPLASLISGNEEIFDLENDVFKISISSKGAAIDQVLLKDHVTYKKEPLILLDKNNHKIDWIFTTQKGSKFDISDLYYQGELKKDSAGNASLILKGITSEGSITHRFTIKQESYVVDYQVSVKGFNSFLSNTNVILDWKEELSRFEKVIDQSRNHTAVNYFNSKGDFDDVTNDTDADRVSENGVNDVLWFSMKQKFFNSGIISPIPMQNGSFTSEFDPNDSSVVKTQTARIEIPYQVFTDDTKQFQFYFGPNNFSILKNVTEGYGENVYLGWTIFASVNKYTIVPFFNFLENYIANYGLLILILVFVVKLLLSPLSFRSYVSMAKMKVLRPEIEDIKKKFGEDQQKVQMETMQLYQKFGVNPLSGCVPMVLQIPVLFALFNFFPNSVELRQKSFLWADDLSTYDSIFNLPFEIPFYGSHVSLFTLLMTVSTLAYTYVQNQNNPMQQQGPMKTMQYFFPFMIMFFLNNFSSGLTYYYFLSNVITIAQQLLIARFIDDKAIRSKLEIKKEKRSTQKKTGFSARLEEALKSQQQKTQEKLKNTKKKN